MSLKNFESVPVDVFKKKMEDKRNQFLSHVNHSFEDADHSREERVQDWREAWEYYRRIQPVFKNRSFCIDYIEPVLQDAVDSILPSMLNVFAENQSEAVKFRPRSKFVQSKIADAINYEINDIFLRQNNGYKKLQDALVEVLVTGDVYGKVYAEESLVEESAAIDEWMPVMLMTAMLEEYPDTDLAQFETRTKEGIEEFKTDGSITLKRVDTKIKFDYVPFGELYTDTIATDIDNARYVAQRIPMTKGEALARFPDREDVIRTANTINSLSESQTSLVKMETLKTPASKDDYYTSYIDELEVDIYLYEHYIYSSILEDGKKQKLYQVFTVDGEATEVLEVNEVGCMPFIKGEVMSLPDSFWGISLHSVLKNEQRLLTWLTNEIAENSTAANMRRYTALKGAYDRKSLLDNRQGGVVEIQAQGAIQPMPYHPLSTSTNDLYSKVQDSVNESKGNAMSLDMNGALNNAAASTVALAVQNAEMQDKKYSKVFAQTFMKPLFDKIYQLIKTEKIDIEYEGEVIKSANLPCNYEFTVDVNTSSDGARIAGQLTNIATMEAQLSSSESPIISAQERYEIYSEMLKVTGATIDKFVKNPADHKPSPQEVAEQQELKQGQSDMMRLDLKLKEVELRKAAMELIEVEADIKDKQQKTQIDAVEAFAKLQKENEELTLEQGKAMADTLQKDQELATAQMIAESDIALSRELQNPHVNISH